MGNDINEILSLKKHPIINKTEITPLNLNSEDGLIAVNSSYLAFSIDDSIQIYDIKSLKSIKTIKCISFIKYFKFHPKFKNVFIASLASNEINIWHINFTKPKCIINKKIIYSIVNPEDINLLASTSNDKTIKIWNMNEISVQKNILLEDCAKIMKWSLSGNYLGVRFQNFKLIVFNKKDWSLIFSSDISSFYSF